LRRFVIPSDAVSDGCITVSGELYHHMVHDYRGRIGQVGNESLTVTVEESKNGPSRPDLPRITVFQGLPKGDKLEFVIQKCTELGVDEIVAYVAERSISRPSDNRVQEKLRRWNRIALEASRQANRLTIPRVGFASDLSAACKTSNHELRILLWEGEKYRPLRQLLDVVGRPESVAVMIGPEGGLTAHEVESASGNGFVTISLGDRVMRTETAAMAMAAILQFHWGNLG
jgi:16S rRNA (uracil1498-N3)-methyltransferase